MPRSVVATLSTSHNKDVKKSRDKKSIFIRSAAVGFHH